jgi:lysophospholipase L1-like esterase
MRLLALASFLAVVATGAQAAGWMGSWAASPAPVAAPASDSDARRRPPSFDDQTIIQTLRLSIGGGRLRVRLSNEYGSKPLVIGAARVVMLGPDGKPVAGTDRELKFAQRSGVSIPAGAPMLSDPIALPTPALARLQVSLYLAAPTPECSCHMQGGEAAEVSPKGDYTQRDFQSAPGEKPSFRAFLSAVEVETAKPGRVIVAFGDSITDGYLSTLGANRRYPDRLAERLMERSPKPPVAVVNAGISGNRLLADGLVPPLGRSALARFDRDVLAVPGVTHVLVLEGVNDIALAGVSPPPAQDLIAGYTQLIDRAHAHGLKVIGGTMLPYEGSTYFRPQGDALRQELNTWIRTSGRFDAVVDFDAAVRDASRPSRLRAEYQGGDWLHLNDAGYRAMADAVDLATLR